MADKEATVFVIDVARSMGKCHSGREESDLDWSLKYVWDKIGYIVGTGRKTLNVGIIGIGTNGTDNDMAAGDPSYNHISVLQPVAQMLLKDLQRLPKILKPSNTDNRDILSGIILGIDLIMKHCKHLKYKKRLIVTTNGAGGMDPDDLDQVAETIKDNGIELVILGIDFDDSNYGFKEEDKSTEKAENEQTLWTLTTKCDGMFGTMQEAIEGIARPEVKQTRPVPTYRGSLRLGNNETYDTALTIDVERYFKTSVRRPPTATSFAINQSNTQTNGNDGLANIQQQFAYEINDPTSGNGKAFVSREELAKGYEYGRTAVHISESDENITKLETYSSYDILGFIPAENVERYMIIENTNMIVSQKGNDKAALALSSFIHALYELGSLAVARLVKKDMTEPIIALLSPLVEPDFECLIENVLPFAEDVRTYRFPPLDKILTVDGKAKKEHIRLPPPDLLDAMSDYVDSMSLIQPDDEELLPLDDIFSPVLHTIEGAIKYRAIHPDQPLPPKPELFSSYSTQPAHLQESAKPALDHLIKIADVRKVPPKQRGRKRDRETNNPISGLDVDSLFKSDAVKRSKIDPKNAKAEFKQLMDATESEADMQDIINQMTAIIEKLIHKSYGKSDYDRATELLGVLREEMFGLEMAGGYNDYMKILKKKVKGGELNGDREEWWHQVRTARLGLITKDEGKSEENRDDVVGGVSEEVAGRFWSEK